jgi:tryptophan-rich sensory protein
LASTVEGYLAELRTALAGADPALVQDALYDAEDFLRSAIAENGDTPEGVAAAIEAYGAPEEIASAYRDAEKTAAVVLRPPTHKPAATWYGKFFGIVADPAAWGSLFYMLLALATGILYFTIITVGLSLTLGLSILIIGIPLALLFIATVRAISLAEGRIVEGLLGVRMPRRPRTIASGSMWDRIKSWFTDSRTWTTMLYMLLQLPLGIAYFTIAVTGLALAAGLIAAPFAQVFFDMPIARNFDTGYYLYPWAMPLVIAAGVLGFFGTLWVAKGIGFLQGQYAKIMLVGNVERSAS